MSGIRMFVAGVGGLVCISTIFLLIFVNGIIVTPLTQFLFGASYPVAYGINMVPVIQGAILFLALAGAIICIAAVWIEVFAEVSYYPEV